MRRWRRARLRRGGTPPATGKQQEDHGTPARGRSTAVPRRDAGPDDARRAPCRRNALLRSSTPYQIGTRDPHWTRHDVGGQRADHERKREPGDGHENGERLTGVRAEPTTMTRPRRGGSNSQQPGLANPPSAARDGNRTAACGVEKTCLTGNAPLRKARKPRRRKRAPPPAQARARYARIRVPPRRQPGGGQNGTKRARKERLMPKTQGRRNGTEYREPGLKRQLHARTGHRICAVHMQIMTLHDGT